MKVRQPLVEAMLNYQAQQVYPLHTPGHKGGRGMASPLKEALGPAALQLDVSLMSELDDIHAPGGCIKEAQALAARLYGSDACFFAVNGTTQAIHAMFLTALAPGEKVLVPRNSHRSVSGGLLLSQARPVYLVPEFLEDFSLYGQITPAQVEQAFSAHPDLKAVFLTSPNYYGLAADVAGIARVAHAHGAVLLVDEAHGPHLGFNKELLPPSALQGGADMCAQSTHKLLGALTQCSMLQVQGTRIEVSRAAEVMSLLTTTSPNYLLLGSLDAARAQLEEQGAALAEAAVQAARGLRQLLEHKAGLRLLDKKVIGRAGIAGLDETKITVNLRQWGVSGVEAGEFLRERGLAVELVDAENVLFLVTYADLGPEWPGVVERLQRAWEEMEDLASEDNMFALLPRKGNLSRMPAPQPLRSLREVFYGRKEVCPLREAAGRICAEEVSFYPPGIPVLLPGEVLTPEIITYCKYMKELGLPVHGAADETLATIKVAADSGCGG